MGLTAFLKKKLEGDPQEREIRKRQDLALKRAGEQARWEGKRKGTVKREYNRGRHEGEQGGGGILNTLAKIGEVGQGISSSPVFENPFETEHRKRHSKRGKRRREPEFPF
jgi:hypothetical protein